MLILCNALINWLLLSRLICRHRSLQTKFDALRSLHVVNGVWQIVHW